MLERIQGWVICDTAFMPLNYKRLACEGGVRRLGFGRLTQSLPGQVKR